MYSMDMAMSPVVIALVGDCATTLLEFATAFMATTAPSANSRLSWVKTLPLQKEEE